MDETKKQIFARIDALSEKLGVAAGHLWESLVTQVVIEGYIYGITCLIALMVTIIASYKIFKSKLPFMEPGYDGGPTIKLFWACVIFVSSLVCLCVFFDGQPIQRMINPDYYAFKEIAYILK